MGKSSTPYIRKGSISYILLTALEKTIDGYVKFDDFVNNPYRYAFGSEREVKKSELAQALKRLKENDFIKQDMVEDEVILKLTETGRDLIGADGEKEWDGKWRIVIFDVPEQKRLIRNMFRRNLKKWGFKSLQKSVWISKRNIYDRLVNCINDLGMSEWVVVIESDKATINDII